MRHRLAHEIATAIKVTDNELPVVIAYRKPTHANTLVDVARAIERLSAKRRKLRRELKVIEGELKARKKELKTLIKEVRGHDA